MEKIGKTNAMRILDKARIPYIIHSYAHNDGEAVDGMTIASLLDQPTEKVFKTLVTCGASGDYFVFVIPVALELDLKVAAKAVKEKSVAMIHVAEINKVTGYIRGGCSPIGMKKLFCTTVHASALTQSTIIFSAGRIGSQIEIAPTDLEKVIKCRFAEIACIAP